MASDYARRGRPRGSGLDDQAELTRIADLLEADPNLRPTTAIKAIGVSDPSSIRRLRDKLKAMPHRPSPLGCGMGEPGPSTAPSRLASSETEFSPSIASGSGGGSMAAVTGGSPLSEAQMSWLAQWCALGVSAVSSTMEAQMAVMNDFFKVPPVEAALRQQLVFNEVAKAFCPKRPDVRTTVH